MSGMDRRKQLALRAALVSGVVSALAVCAIFLAAGAFEDPSEAERPGTTTTPAPAPAISVGELYRRAREGIVLVEHRPRASGRAEGRRGATTGSRPARALSSTTSATS